MLYIYICIFSHTPWETVNDSTVVVLVQQDRAREDNTLLHRCLRIKRKNLDVEYHTRSTWDKRALQEQSRIPQKATRFNIIFVEHYSYNDEK